MGGRKLDDNNIWHKTQKAMTQEQQAKQPRRRGVILTSQGWDKLQQAITESEYEENSGSRYTLETLSIKTGLTPDTITKVRNRELRVDKQTLKCFFRAFHLILETQDYFFPETFLEFPGVGQQEPKLPEGEIAISSLFYIERPTIEEDCYQAIVQPGSLIRIKSPKRTGKTSLTKRILHYAENQGYQTVFVSLQLADKHRLQNLDKFLRCLCATVGEAMQLPNRIDDYWDDLFGSNISCKLYFEQYLLAKTEKPVVIALDDVDRLFLYPDLADDFFPLLRFWHEEAKNKAIWQKLRLIVVHSTEVYIPLNLNQSPFNVGLPINLPKFTLEQIKELANRYQLCWSNHECEQLITLVGKNPFLIHLSLYYIGCGKNTLEQLCDTPTNFNHSIYHEHLQRQLLYLQQTSSDLLESFARVVTAEHPIELDIVKACKLQSLGLVQLYNNKVTPSCQLYTQYFREYFDDFSEAI